MAIVIEEADNYFLAEEPQWDDGPYHLGHCKHCDYETPLATIRDARRLVGDHIGAEHSGHPDGESDS